MKKIIFGIKTLLCLTLLSGVLSLVSLQHSAHAASLSDWNPGKIIDDAVFTNANTMDAATIQNFLNSKVPLCDTYGAQTSEYGGGARSQWGAANYGQSTFTCLKDYSENGKTSAQIIYDTAQQYKINPQVLLVLLQKEQGLVTDTWPLNVQYRTATGYGCPDTAACDSQYFGLTNQLHWAATMFRAIVNNSPTWYTPYILGSNYIQYSPDSSCGGSTVNITNRATQALYNYTPYQPNQAALAAGYGTVSCGAYGNRNFYLYFTDWFGSTTSLNSNIILSKELSLTSTSGNGMVYQGDTVTGGFEVSNTASYDASAGGLGICATMDGQNYDIGFKDQNVIPANGKTSFSFSKKIDRPGTLYVHICSYNESMGGWAAQSYYPYDISGVMLRSVTKSTPANPIVTTSVTLSPAKPVIGAPVTASVTLSNASPVPSSVGMLVIAARDSQGNNVDFPADPELIVPANGTVTYTKTQTFTRAGQYSFFLANLNAGQWSTTYPQSNGTIARSGTFTVDDNPLISSSLSISPQNPAIGQQTTASFTVTNASPTPIAIGTIVVAARDSQGNNVDFPADTSITVAGNSTYTYTQTRIFTGVGAYTTFIANYNNNNWGINYPKSSNPTITRSVNFNVKDNPLVTTGISYSPSQPVAGQPATVQFNIRNDSSSPVSLGTILVAARDPQGKNVDFPADTNLTIPASTTYTYTKTITLSTPGNYSFFIANFRNSLWDMNYPTSNTSSIIRSVNVPVRDNPYIISGITLQPTNPVKGQDITASVTLRNDSSAPVSVGMLVIAARDSQGNNVDFPADPELIVPANGTVTYTKTRQFISSGSYSFFIASYKNSQWSSAYPKSLNTSIVRSLTKFVN